MSARQRLEREKFWTEWLRELAQDMGARLAETIGVEPSGRERIRELVNAAIILEQELAGEVEAAAPKIELRGDPMCDHADPKKCRACRELQALYDKVRSE